MPVYFIRHGQTLGNAANLWVGLKDESLTPTGIIELKKSLKSVGNINFSSIQCSPLKRAVQTAIIAKKILRLDFDIEVIDVLKERDFGDFEGMPKTLENRNALEKCSNAETTKDLALRIKPFFEKMSLSEETHLVVSHSAVFRCLVNELGYTSTPLRTSLKNSECVQLHTFKH